MKLVAESVEPLSQPQLDALRSVATGEPFNARGMGTALRPAVYAYFAYNPDAAKRLLHWVNASEAAGGIPGNLVVGVASSNGHATGSAQYRDSISTASLEAVLLELRKHKRALSTGELSDKAGVSRSTASTAVRVLRQRGHLEAEGSGPSSRWRLTEEGRGRGTGD